MGPALVEPIVGFKSRKLFNKTGTYWDENRRILTECKKGSHERSFVKTSDVNTRDAKYALC